MQVFAHEMTTIYISFSASRLAPSLFPSAILSVVTRHSCRYLLLREQNRYRTNISG